MPDTPITIASAAQRLAAEIGQSVRTVQLFLKEREPSRSGWWRPTPEQYEAAKAELLKPGHRKRGGLRFHRR